MTDIEGFKLKFTQRDHHPSGEPKFSHLLGPKAINEDRWEISDNLIPHDRGKKRFPPLYSSSELGPRGKRHIPPPPGKGEIVTRGKRCIHPLNNSNSEISFQTKKPDLDSSMKRSESCLLPAIGWTTKKAVDQDQEPKSYNIESTMNRKQRIKTDLDKRNDIPVSTLGDKSYKEADMETGFYAQGGIIPGSTIVERKSAKPTLRKSEDSTSTIKPKKLEATYAKLQARLEYEYELNQVLALTVI